MKKIMVVDDEPDQVFTIKKTLEELDHEYEVIGANSGEQCLEFLKNNHIPDLIILDIMMPGLSGWETYSLIRGNGSWENIPVIFLSARKDTVAKKAGVFYGEDFIERVTQAFTQLDINNPEHKEILDLFSAEKFIVTENGNYLEIETIGRETGKIN